MVNKRQHKRVPIAATATLNFMDGNVPRVLQTMVASISLGGIGVYSDEPIEINSDVSTTVNFVSAGGTIKTDSVEGHVVYDRKIGDIYFIGVQFDVEINPDGQPSLYEHTEKILTWEK